ncbi:hypothetical protein GFL85_27140 [Rhizobium laguerreae]|uniref:hypothetical protein n=1 Tax=Rhizobium laguerreae TaxID=1076926 RepID=UPI00143F7D5F|nr:hypothetical protein [Rhizobium laguerreae]NKM14643.1 hypothetical protein [Rhizobium laguerreae]
MLHPDDMIRFREHYEAACQNGYEASLPAEVLSTEEGLFPAELFRLALSLQIAAVAGDAEIAPAACLRMIIDQMGGKQSLDLKCTSEWRSAIAWCLSPSMVPDQTVRATMRSIEVGNACKRLRDRGIKIEINAFGVEVTDRLQTDIATRMESYVQLMGGAEVVKQVCSFVSACQMIHDGMWLLGNRVPHLYAGSMPAFPVGWVYSLGLRFAGKRGTARKPAVVWKSIIELAVDFAAVLDCQRYSQFEEMDVHASQAERNLRESLLWRELFVLPQVPAVALRD